jgi:glycosyltransferase involved in cell wall biosynthesis
MIKFSICIPNYNYANFIGETIESVLAQTYPHFEIIIVDNASTDNSWQVIEDFASKDDRIRSFRNNYNVGFSHNLDIAASKANYNYIIMVSSDDTLKPNALFEYEKVISQILDVNNNLFFICSAVDVIDQNNQIIDTYFRKNYHNIKSEGNFEQKFKDNQIADFYGINIFKDVIFRLSTVGHFNTTLYTKEMYNKVSGYSSINLIGPDTHFVYKCLLLNPLVIFIDKPLFNYRIHSNGQLSQGLKNKNINLLIDRYIFTQNFRREIFSQLNISYDLFIFNVIRNELILPSIDLLRRGEFVFSMRFFLFGFSAYSFKVFLVKESYLLLLLLFLGPFGILILRILYKIKNIL